MNSDQRTVVRHSGYGYGGNPQFARGLETRAVATKALADKIRKAGGLLFSGPDGGYAAAERYAEAEMYPPEVGGLTPAAPGTFAELEVDGLAVYVPPVRPVTAGEVVAELQKWTDPDDPVVLTAAGYDGRYDEPTSGGVIFLDQVLADLARAHVTTRR